MLFVWLTVAFVYVAVSYRIVRSWDKQLTKPLWETEWVHTDGTHEDTTLASIGWYAVAIIFWIPLAFFLWIGSYSEVDNDNQ